MTLKYAFYKVDKPHQLGFAYISFKFFSIFNICAVLCIVIIVFLLMKPDMFSYLQISPF